jgi:hypothetical protein
VRRAGLYCSGSGCWLRVSRGQRVPSNKDRQGVSPDLALKLTCDCACCQALVHDVHQLRLTTHLSLNST